MQAPKIPDNIFWQANNNNNNKGRPNICRNYTRILPEFRPISARIITLAFFFFFLGGGGLWLLYCLWLVFYDVYLIPRLTPLGTAKLILNKGLKNQ